MHKNYFPRARENKIRRARQILAVQAITETHFIDKFANNQFRFGVFSLDTCHHPGALFGGNDVHQRLCWHHISADVGGRLLPLSDGCVMKNFVIVTILVDSIEFAKRFLNKEEKISG